VTVDGILIDTSEEHPLKACPPIVVTADGISIDTREDSLKGKITNRSNRSINGNMITFLGGSSNPSAPQIQIQLQSRFPPL